MIQVGVQTGGPEKYYNVDESYRVIAEAGFDGVDVNLDHLLCPDEIRKLMHVPVYSCDDNSFLEYFRPWKEAAEKYGIQNFQAHAPFPTHIAGEEGYDNYLIDVLKKTIQGCAYIGCHRLVIHPFFQPYIGRENPEAEWERNITSYSALIPAAKACGVMICLENMFSVYNGSIYANCCSDITTACRYIDELNKIAGEKIFGFCLDTGHLLLCKLDLKDAIVRLGNRIECLHVHDNNGLEDQHIAPYTGVMDWKHFMEGLKAIGYDKPMCFETFNIWNKFPKDICPEVMRTICKTGRYFAKQIEK